MLNGKVMKIGRGYFLSLLVSVPAATSNDVPGLILGPQESH